MIKKKKKINIKHQLTFKKNEKKRNLKRNINQCDSFKCVRNQKAINNIKIYKTLFTYNT